MSDLFSPLTRDDIKIDFVIFVSYGNDSCALIQWAHEHGLQNVACVYTDTGWGADGWRERVDTMERWTRSLGFMTFRTYSMGFAALARWKKGFPTQRYQWCSFILKIEPGQRWLETYDPTKAATCLVGVRRDESVERINFPLFLQSSPNHGDRPMLAPFACMSADQRNAVLARAGIEPLPHRSRECKCINSKKEDIRRFTDNDKREIATLEAEIGRPLFRPHRHMGATGIDEMVKWAHSERGKYTAEPDGLPDENLAGCNTGYCE